MLIVLGIYIFGEQLSARWFTEQLKLENYKEDEPLNLIAQRMGFIIGETN
jgi:hypothetical protein